MPSDKQPGLPAWQRDAWNRALDRARAAMDDPYNAGASTMSAATEVLAIARVIAGIACERCAGAGTRTYGSTATWRGGIGGQILTEDICDRCWGTGRNDRTGVNLRAQSEFDPQSEALRRRPDQEPR